MEGGALRRHCQKARGSSPLQYVKRFYSANTFGVVVKAN
jgi:hypothetical protein